MDLCFDCLFYFLNFLVSLLLPAVSLRYNTVDGGERQRLLVYLLGSHGDRLLPSPLGLTFDTAVEDVVDSLVSLQSGPGVAHAVGLLVQGGDGRNVETVPGVEYRVRGTAGEAGPFLHILVCETIQGGEIRGSDIMDGEEESNSGEKVIGINPKFILRSDEGVLNVVELFCKDVFEIFKALG